MAPYRALVQRRLELQFGNGTAEELGQLTREVTALTSRLEVSEGDRLAQLDAIAELAARVVPMEQEAAAALGMSAAAAS
jgi:hypothetical protein